MKTSAQLRKIALEVGPRNVYIQEVHKYLEPINDSLRKLEKEFNALAIGEKPVSKPPSNDLTEEQTKPSRSYTEFTALREMLRKIIDAVGRHIQRMDDSFWHLASSDVFKLLQTLKDKLQQLIKALDKNIFKKREVYEMLPDKPKFDKLFNALKEDVSGLSKLDQREVEDMESLGAY